MSRRRGRRGRSSLRPPVVLASFLSLLLLGAGSLPAQYRIAAPSGEELSFSRDSVLSMLSRTRALYDTLEADPRIVYYVGYGRHASEERPGEVYPWNAVTVESDSAVRVVVPGDLREADRAYFNYAVVRMRERAASEAASELSCREIVAREVRILDAFADGWIVSRTLFGSPEHAALTEIPFARAAGHLDAFLVDRAPPRVADCAEPWAEAHRDRLEAYRTWRSRRFSPGAPAEHSLLER